MEPDQSFHTTHRPFTLQEYDPAWVDEYNKRAEIIKKVFGDELVEVQHIGSTSVPGMTAKPQIDILAVVKDFSKIESFYPAMNEAGFTPRGKGLNIGDEYFTEDAPGGKRIAGVHVYPYGDAARDRYLNFRDYLRSHKEERDLYSSTKKAVYGEHSGNYFDYVRGKDAVIVEIKQRAETWAKTNRESA